MKFRLRSAHYWPGDLYLVGDKEKGGGEDGTIVGDGTPYKIVPFSKRSLTEPCMTPTMEMEPLDEEAEEALLEEQERLNASAASMVPIEQLARQMESLKVNDEHETKYVPGFDKARRGK